MLLIVFTRILLAFRYYMVIWYYLHYNCVAFTRKIGMSQLLLHVAFNIYYRKTHIYIYSVFLTLEKYKKKYFLPRYTLLYVSCKTFFVLKCMYYLLLRYISAVSIINLLLYVSQFQKIRDLKCKTENRKNIV